MGGERDLTSRAPITATGTNVFPILRTSADRKNTVRLNTGPGLLDLVVVVAVLDHLAPGCIRSS